MKSIPKATKNALKRVRKFLITIAVVGIAFGVLIGLSVALIAF